LPTIIDNFISGKSLAKDIDDFMAASTDLATLGSSVGCFVVGTTVKTEEGDKAIEEIEVGDKVLSYEATTGRFAYKEVADVIAHDGVTELAHVTIGGETIDSTTNHPYFVVGYGYVDAGNLIEGDTVLLANGKEGKVEKVEIEFLTEPVTVYNFEVKDWHCYFVGEAGVLVHNDSCVSTSGAGNTGGNTNGNSGEGGSKADVLAQNRAKGRAFEQQEFAKFKSQNKNAVEQITVKTSSGVRTRVDAIGLDANGNVVINEYKSSLTAPLTDNQKIAFPEIFESGATVVGNGKGIFSVGYQIPSGTKVTIIRPE